jgi:hypothetical protein
MRQVSGEFPEDKSVGNPPEIDIEEKRRVEKRREKKSIDNFEVPVELIELVELFKTHRRKSGDSMTNYAVELFVARLLKLSTDKATQEAIIKNAIEHNWKTVYPVEEKVANKYGPQKISNQDLQDNVFSMKGCLK